MAAAAVAPPLACAAFVLARPVLRRPLGVGACGRIVVQFKPPEVAWCIVFHFIFIQVRMHRKRRGVLTCPRACWRCCALARRIEVPARRAMFGSALRIGLIQWTEKSKTQRNTERRRGNQHHHYQPQYHHQQQKQQENNNDKRR